MEDIKKIRFNMKFYKESEKIIIKKIINGELSNNNPIKILNIKRKKIKEYSTKNKEDWNEY